MSESTHFHHLHDARFDPFARDAHDFVRGIGVEHAISPDRVTIVHEDADIARVKAMLGANVESTSAAWYLPGTEEVVADSNGWA